jgi:neutral ceramidase
MKCCLLVVLTILLAAVVPRQATAQGPARLPSLRAGAAKVDITPSPAELPKNSRGVLDRLYARAIVLENGISTAALITIDAGAVPDALW